MTITQSASRFFRIAFPYFLASLAALNFWNGDYGYGVILACLAVSAVSI